MLHPVLLQKEETSTESHVVWVAIYTFIFTPLYHHLISILAPTLESLFLSLCCAKYNLGYMKTASDTSNSCITCARKIRPSTAQPSQSARATWHVVFDAVNVSWCFTFLPLPSPNIPSMSHKFGPLISEINGLD